MESVKEVVCSYWGVLQQQGSRILEVLDQGAQDIAEFYENCPLGDEPLGDPFTIEKLIDAQRLAQQNEQRVQKEVAYQDVIKDFPADQEERRVAAWRYVTEKEVYGEKEVVERLKRDFRLSEIEDEYQDVVGSFPQDGEARKEAIFNYIAEYGACEGEEKSAKKDWITDRLEKEYLSKEDKKDPRFRVFSLEEKITS